MSNYSPQILSWMPEGQQQIFCRYYLSCLTVFYLTFSSNVKMSLYTKLILLQQKLYWIAQAYKPFPSSIYAAVVVIYPAAYQSAWKLFICYHFLYQEVNKYIFNILQMPSKSLFHQVIISEFINQICDFAQMYLIEFASDVDFWVPGVTSGLLLGFSAKYINSKKLQSWKTLGSCQWQYYMTWR